MVQFSDMQKKENTIIVAVLAIGDFLAGLFGLILGYWMRFESGFFRPIIHFCSLSAWIVIDHSRLFWIDYFWFRAAFYNLFIEWFVRSKNILRFRWSVLVIMRAIILWLILYLGLSLVLKFDPPISRLYAVGSAFAVFTVAVLWRWLFKIAIRLSGLSSRFSKRVAFLGWSLAAERLAKLVSVDDDSVYTIIGCISEKTDPVVYKNVTGLLEIGDSANLIKILRSHRIDILVKADSPVDVDKLIWLCNSCDREMVEFKMIPTRFHQMVTGLHIENIVDVPVLGVAQGPLEHPVNRIIKRIIDIFGSIVGILISVPLIFVFGILVYLESLDRLFIDRQGLGDAEELLKFSKSVPCA